MTGPVRATRPNGRSFSQWDLTDAGRAALDSVVEPITTRTVRIGEDWGSSTFCYATGYRVTEILNYSEPAPSLMVMGRIASLVDYRYEIVEPAEWAETAKSAMERLEGRQTVPNGTRVRRDLDSMNEPQEWRTWLVQTGNGWLDQRSEPRN